MALTNKKRKKTKNPAKKTIFQMLGLQPESFTIERTRNRRVVMCGDFALPIIDNHLIVHDENGAIAAFCQKDLKRVLEAIS